MHIGISRFARDIYAKFTVAGYTNENGTARAELQNFPVLVRIARNSPSGFSYDDLHSPTDGDDIAFVGMDGVGLPFEIDTWDPDGTSLIWVRLPTMTNGTEFVMCWGSDTSGKSVCGTNPWDAYTGVWHMGETGTPSDSAPVTIHDSTTNELHGSTAVGESASGSMVGGAWRIAKDNNHDRAIRVPATSGLAKTAADALGTDFHASFWFRAKGEVPWSYLISRRKGEQGTGWGFLFHSGTPPTLMRVHAGSTEYKNSSADYHLGSTLSAQDDMWKKLDVVWKYASNGNVQVADIYLNGAYLETVTCKETVNQQDTDIGIGCSTQDSYSNNGAGKGRRANGEMDEVRLGAFVPSADWIAADYATQTSPSFLTAGKAEPYEETDDPVAGVQVSDFAYTNATVAATVVKRGGTAATARVTVELSATSDFASPLWSTNYTVNVDGDVRAFPVTGLSFGTSYYLRAVVENSEHATLTTPAVSFTTQTPGTPAVSAETGVIGFSSFSVVALPTDIGTGGEKVTLWLDVSAAGDFSDTLSFGGVETNAVPASIPLVATGLANGTAYAARVRAVNVWGLEAVSPMLSITTRAVPLAATGIVYSFSVDGTTTDISFGIAEVFDGAYCTATLEYNGRTYPAQSFSIPKVISWTGLAVASGPAPATVTVTATLGGTPYMQTWSTTVSPGVSTFRVSSLDDYSSADTLLRVFVGDRIVLPELSSPASYENLNPRLITKIEHTEGSWEDAVVVTAEAGLAAIRSLDGSGTEMARMGILVMPRPGRNGNPTVYVMKSSATAWCDASSWAMADGTDALDWPHGADVAAMIPSWNESKTITVASPVSIRAVYFGFAGPDGCTFKLNGGGGLNLIPRSRSDGALLRLTSNTATAETQSVFSFSGGFQLSVTEAPGAVIDQGYALDEMDFTNRAYGNFRVSYDNCVVAISEGASLCHTHGSGASKTSLYFSDNADFTGKGELILDTASHTWIWKAFKSFEGTIVVRNRKAPSAMKSFDERDAFLYFRQGSKPLASMRVEGWFTGDDDTSAGLAMVGCHHAWQTGQDKDPHENCWPAKAWFLHGGDLRFRHENREAFAGCLWTNGCERLVFERGLTRINMDHTESDAYPTNSFFVDAVEHSGKATFQWCNQKSYGDNPTSRSRVAMKGLDAFLAGDDGEGEFDVYTNGFHKIVPWMVIPWGWGDSNNPRFACVTPEGDVLAPKWKSWDSSKIAVGGNYYDSYKVLTLPEDKKINSLVLENPNKEGWGWYPSSFTCFGKGRTLTLAGGALGFRTHKCCLGDRLSYEGQNDQKGVGTLRVPNAPLYVWAVANSGGPNEIWVNVDAPHGLVAAYYGHLRLGGVQTNIAEEITVNAGTLILGTEDGEIPTKINVPIRVVGGGAMLRIDAPNCLCNGTPESPKANKDIRLFLEDINGPAKVCLNADDSVWECLVDGKTLRRGTWGSSESAAEYVDDARFSGAKVLRVMHDDLAEPLIIRLK